MHDPLIILRRYWKHPHFRPLQREIIHAVLAEQDTLAVLPTGGGKSVCFQVPAMMREGTCIVITPLIALMKDQVESLERKGIRAVAVHAGMTRDAIDITLDNCVHGSVKFLYISPERIQTELFQVRVQQMKICLLAVDEAHCISQWGYDFRPPYLKVADLRNLLPHVPVIALTASATPLVKDDIINKLQFRQPHQTFQQTFARDNLAFVVRKTENKNKKLLEVLQKVQGPAILYVRSRKATQEVATWLNQLNIPANYYHAGMTFEQRSKSQDEWLRNARRIMVATNAFGMGIDKPDVRTVVHLDLPENIESYYQEAGRAGRDGKRAFAVILYEDADIASLEAKVNQSHPEAPYVKQIYQALANYFQLALGSAEGESFDFDIYSFSDRFSLHMAEVYSALKKLEEEGLIAFSESYYSPSQLHFKMEPAELYAFQVANARFDPFIKMLLRLYGGQLYSGYVKISEDYLANAMKTTVGEITSMLTHLHQLQAMVYLPRKDSPQVTFVLPRQDADHLPLNLHRLKERKELAVSRMKAMIEYTTSTHRCRMNLIQDYFGEETWQPCGTCDVCIAKKKKENEAEALLLRQEIMRLLKNKLMTSEELERAINPKDAELLIEVIREMVDEGVLTYDDVWRLQLRNGLLK
ncbi:MAG: RecQ family ATP-dependent DNA helicase [Flammeovirgaceae bacterium]|nr:MAG: RecQ family ATP-dependent DNA helicase [Flammeovirgaceae bacterium]